jgi:glutamate/aspartate transport system permease protein
VYVVGLKDFLTTTEIIATRDHRVVELFLFAAVVYLILCVIGSTVVRKLQRKYAL